MPELKTTICATAQNGVADPVVELGSSETIREVSFNFDAFVHNSVLHKKSFNKKDLEWFIGFVEGDCSFIVSKHRNFFILTQKDCKVLYKVKKLLGFGSVTKAGDYFRYIVANNADTFKLVCLFNGNLLLNKTNERFKLWLLNYNQLSKTSYQSQLKRYTYWTESMFKNSGWLSGFIDAEGCFYAYLRKKGSLSLRLSLFIDQKNEPFVLEKIAQDFFGYVILRKQASPAANLRKHSLTVACSDNDPRSGSVNHSVEEFHRVVLSSEASRQSVIRYLSKYKLKGDKYISYSRWKRIHNMLISKTLDQINPQKLNTLCKNINITE